GGRRVTVDRTLLGPSQERLALALAVRGPGEEEELLRVLATQQAAEGVELRDPHDLLHALATGRAGARQDQLADQLRLVPGDQLGDHAAHREAVKIDLVETERADERDGVLGHRLDGVGRLGSGGTDAAVVEGDDPVLCGDSVDHPRVLVVEVPCQMHEEDDRDTFHTDLRAELAVGEIDTTSGDGAVWCVLVRRQRAASGFLFLICSAYGHSRSFSSPAGDSARGPCYGKSTSFPVAAELSSSRCARRASVSGRRTATTGWISPRRSSSS